MSIVEQSCKPSSVVMSTIRVFVACMVGEQQKPNCCFAFHAGFPPQFTSQTGPDASIPSGVTELVTQRASSLMAVGSVTTAARQDQAMLGGACQQTSAEATALLPSLERGANRTRHVIQLPSKRTHQHSSF